MISESSRALTGNSPEADENINFSGPSVRRVIRVFLRTEEFSQAMPPVENIIFWGSSVGSLEGSSTRLKSHWQSP